MLDRGLIAEILSLPGIQEENANVLI